MSYNLKKNDTYFTNYSAFFSIFIKTLVYLRRDLSFLSSSSLSRGWLRLSLGLTSPDSSRSPLELDPPIRLLIPPSPATPWTQEIGKFFQK